MANTSEAHDIFVSYDNDDLELVTTLVQQLTAVGWRVWWDRGILPGQTWDEVISKFLKSARCIVVVWTRRSVQSHWVRIEANHGREREVLVPVRLDGAELPLQFELVHTASLVGWDYRSMHPGLNALMAGIRAVLSRDPVAVPPAAAEAVAEEPRALDAAIGRQLVVRQPASLIAMIRLASSDGLRMLLGQDNDYNLEPTDVSSRPFDVAFPIDAAGRRQPAELILRISAPAFEPPEQRKKLRVVPERDSTVFEFLLTPLKMGLALVQVEIYERDVCMASRILRPSCVTAQATEGREIVSMPLLTHVGEVKSAPKAIAAAASNTGEFTQLFGGPSAAGGQLPATTERLFKSPVEPRPASDGAPALPGDATQIFSAPYKAMPDCQAPASGTGAFTQILGSPTAAAVPRLPAKTDRLFQNPAEPVPGLPCAAPRVSPEEESQPPLADRLPSTRVLAGSVLVGLFTFLSIVRSSTPARASLPEPGALAAAMSVTNAKPVIAREDAMVLLFDERLPAPTPGRRLVFSRTDALISLVTAPED